MDGTTIDNNPFHIKAWDTFAQKYNIPFSLETYQTKFSDGTNANALEILFGPNLTNEQVQKSI